MIHFTSAQTLFCSSSEEKNSGSGTSLSAGMLRCLCGNGLVSEVHRRNENNQERSLTSDAIPVVQLWLHASCFLSEPALFFPAIPSSFVDDARSCQNGSGLRLRDSTLRARQSALCGGSTRRECELLHDLQSYPNEFDLQLHCVLNAECPRIS
eukprot:2001750-Rhodomonas_salina.3